MISSRSSWKMSKKNKRRKESHRSSSKDGGTHWLFRRLSKYPTKWKNLMRRFNRLLKAKRHKNDVFHFFVSINHHSIFSTLTLLISLVWGLTFNLLTKKANKASKQSPAETTKESGISSLFKMSKTIPGKTDNTIIFSIRSVVSMQR